MDVFVIENTIHLLRLLMQSKTRLKIFKDLVVVTENRNDIYRIVIELEVLIHQVLDSFFWEFWDFENIA